MNVSVCGSYANAYAYAYPAQIFEGRIIKYVYLGSNQHKQRGPYQVVGKAKPQAKEGEGPHIPLLHPSISRRHAVFCHTDKGLYLVDLHSANSTYLNNEAMTPGQPYRLHDYDIVEFGGSTKKYKLKGLGYNREKDTTEAEGEEAKASKGFEGEEEAPKDRETGSRSTPRGVQISHLLVKHRDVRRPTSWRNEGSSVERSVQQAENRIHMLRSQILARGKEGSQSLNAVFERVCTKESVRPTLSILSCSAHAQPSSLFPAPL